EKSKPCVVIAIVIITLLVFGDNPGGETRNQAQALQPNFCLAFCKSPSKAKIINHFYIAKSSFCETFVHGSCNTKNKNFKMGEDCMRVCGSAIRSW
ncbi:hypothetical protein K5549_021623, partial [Capra hircus]